jgi:ABC-type sugar transport system substrate-binding protein
MVNLETEELFRVSCDWSEASGRQECTLALAEFGRDIEVVLCANASIAMGAKQAISDRGYTLGQDILVVATGDSEPLQQAILEGTVGGTVTQDMEEFTSLLHSTVKALLKKTAVGAKNYVNYIILDKEALS